MKIGYDAAGNILAVTIDSQQLSAPHILTVADNQDYLMNPSKYKIVGGAIVLK